MHPVFHTELSSDFPAGAIFKTPKPSEIDEEGFGNFRDVFDLRGTTVKEARTYLAAHRRVLEFIDALATAPDAFEEYAQAFEVGNAADAGLSGNAANQIDGLIESQDCDLGGLELGVGLWRTPFLLERYSQQLAVAVMSLGVGRRIRSSISPPTGPAPNFCET